MHSIPLTLPPYTPHHPTEPTTTNFPTSHPKPLSFPRLPPPWRTQHVALGEGGAELAAAPWGNEALHLVQQALAHGGGVAALLAHERVQPALVHHHVECPPLVLLTHGSSAHGTRGVADGGRLARVGGRGEGRVGGVEDGGGMKRGEGKVGREVGGRGGKEQHGRVRALLWCVCERVIALQAWG
ncbi:unnamed protein product [Closterium sp. NIES-53]